MKPRKQKKRPKPKAVARAAKAKAAKRLRPLPRFDQEQRYACRDCPARCCRMPWGIRFSPEEGERIAGDPWVQERVSERGLTLLRSGVLPMREHAQRPQCVFLDEDDRCGLQGEHGHDFIPRACQVFPFGFMMDEDDKLLGSVSNLCPSIRDDYGEPALPLLPDKIEQQGALDTMSTAMSTLNGVFLSRAQYLEVAAHWKQRLTQDDQPLAACAELFNWMTDFERALPTISERVSDDVVRTAMRAASDKVTTELVTGDRNAGYHGRLLFAHLLGNLCYPSRVLLDHRVESAPWFHFQKARAFINRLSWLLDWGSHDMMFIDEPVSLRRASRVTPPATGALGEKIAAFLALAIDRRQIFAQPRHLQNVLLDLTIAACLVSRFARCRAAAARRSSANADDVREGIGVAELLIISHVSLSSESQLLQNLRWTMLTQTASLRRLLGAEAT